MEELLTSKEKEILNQFRDLLEFGSDIFLKYLKIDSNSKNYKKNFICFYFGAIHNYSEAIYVLCKDARPHATVVLLRSVLEAFINVTYLTNAKSDLKIAKYTIKDFEERIKILKQFKKFVEKYPDWENKNGMTNIKALDKLIKHNQRVKTGIEKGNKFHESTVIEPNLRKRVEAYDKKSKANGDWEYNYILIYKYFSAFTHLSISGIESFVEKEGREINFDIGQSKGVEAHLVTAFGIYVTLLNDIKKRGYLPKEISLNSINKELKNIQKS